MASPANVKNVAVSTFHGPAQVASSSNGLLSPHRTGSRSHPLEQLQDSAVVATSLMSNGSKPKRTKGPLPHGSLLWLLLPPLQANALLSLLCASASSCQMYVSFHLQLVACGDLPC